jgi:hypothetical protein
MQSARISATEPALNAVNDLRLRRRHPAMTFTPGGPLYCRSGSGTHACVGPGAELAPVSVLKEGRPVFTLSRTAASATIATSIERFA